VKRVRRGEHCSSPCQHHQQQQQQQPGDDVMDSDAETGSQSALAGR